jgi:predicted kinase
MEKDLVLVRGISGSGKSTFAALLGRAICSADDYLVTRDGKYEWEAWKLRRAHEWCLRKCERFMKLGISPSVVCNTSPRKRDLAPYYALAEKYGYRVFSVIIENRHGGSSIHDVPDESLEKQVKRFDIKLK